MWLIGRVGAMVFGLVGVVIAAITNVFYSTIHHAMGTLGDSSLDRTHGGIGFLLVLIGAVGAFTALVSPSVAAVLLLAAGIGMFFIGRGYAVFSVLFFVIAALLAVLARSAPPSNA